MSDCYSDEKSAFRVRALGNAVGWIKARADGGTQGSGPDTRDRQASFPACLAKDSLGCGRREAGGERHFGHRSSWRFLGLYGRVISSRKNCFGSSPTGTAERTFTVSVPSRLSMG